jgi:signal transduction histidine kinase
LDLSSDGSIDMPALQHIPLWVFGLFIGLVALGWVQTRTHQVRKLQLLSAKVALTVVTLISVVQLWWPTPWLAIALISWALTGLFMSWALSQSAAPAGASFNPATQRFTLPGSWLPLALFMAIFACKFVVGMLSAVAPELIRSLPAAIGISALYGLLSGIVIARVWLVLKLQTSPTAKKPSTRSRHSSNKRSKSAMNTHPLLAWLPAHHRRPLLQRLLIVWAVAFLISLDNWNSNLAKGDPSAFDVSLVYAYAISTFIWLLTDVPRFAFKRLLRSPAPYYWPPALPAALMLLVGIPLGYVLGTLVGDAYSGKSTWELWYFNRNRFWGLMVSALAISAAFVVYFSQRGKAESLANEVTQAQLMLLQSQLEPHMLFNTLAHLRALIGQDTARAHAMLDHLNDYLRTTLQATRLPMHQALHPLGDEFSRLGDYLSLMAIRMGPRMAFELDLPPALATASVPRFILQPLVENAIRHGLEPQVSGGRIEVQARAEGAQLLLTVRDNGSGISELALADAARPLQADGAQAGPSWGLSHVRQRLLTLYGPRAGMHISHLPTGGTCVVLTLPFTTPTA